tara:strand:- start:1922 stop:2134 length:213 start_codon:yes stop_codon:yes gene_type:complete
MIKLFNIKRLVVMLGWAETLTWCVTTKKETRTLYFSLHKVTENKSKNNAYGIIIGPVTIMFGLSDKKIKD